MIGAALVFAVGLLQSGGERSAVRVTASVSPDTVAVGQPVTLTVRVTAPFGSLLVFPEAVDSVGSVEPLDPVSVRPPASPAESEFVATYRLLAWKPGVTTVPLGPIQLEHDDGTELLTVPAPEVYVSSVLPADTALRDPRSAREIIASPPNRLGWVLGALAVVALAALAFWLASRRRRAAAAPPDPYVSAQRAFGRLGALDRSGAGEPARHVSTAADIVREYFAARDARATRGLTTPELIGVISEDPDVPARRVEALFTSCDLVKFAPQSADASMAEALVSEAESIVRTTHRASKAHEDREPAVAT
jgi:hypothetical protein